MGAFNWLSFIFICLQTFSFVMHINVGSVFNKCPIGKLTNCLLLLSSSLPLNHHHRHHCRRRCCRRHHHISSSL